MKKILIILLVLLLSLACYGEVWEDGVISIDIPDGWEKNTPPAKGIQFFYLYPEHNVMVSLIKQKNKEGILPKQATLDYVNAILNRQNAENVDKSEIIINKRFVSIVTFKFKVKDKDSHSKMLTVSEEGNLYSLTALSFGKELPQDRKLEAIFKSLNFNKTIKEKDDPELLEAEKAGEIFAYVVLIGGVIMIVLIQLRKSKRNSNSLPQ